MAETRTEDAWFGGESAGEDCSGCESFNGVSTDHQPKLGGELGEETELFEDLMGRRLALHMNISGDCKFDTYQRLLLKMRMWQSARAQKACRYFHDESRDGG